MKAAEAVAQVLVAEGVEQIFCFPSNPLIDAAAAAGIRPVVGREERTVVNMADAFSRVTNGRQVGVVMVQGGPGAEHAFGGVAQAFSDSVPLLLFAGGAARHQAGLRSAFDVVEAFRPITKWGARLTSAASVPVQLRRAFAKFRLGRPGPVVIEVPQDVLGEELPGAFAYERPVGVRAQADPAAVEEAARLLVAARRPVLHAGHGVLWAEATDELVALAELVGAPVCTTYNGKSAFPEDHPLALGAGGAAVSPGIHAVVPEADLVCSIGSSLLRTLGSFGLPAGVRIIQATADPDDLAMEYPIVAGLVGDAKLVLGQLVEAVTALGAAGAAWEGRAAEHVAEQRRAAEATFGPHLTADEVPIDPYRVVGELCRLLDPARTIVTHDSGYPRDHLAPIYVATTPRGYLGWGNSTPLGSSLGLALGAKLAAPDKLVVHVLGDAAFGQSGLDLETAVRNRLGVLTVLINNSEMGNYEKMQPVAQERYGIKHLTGDYTPIARALGAHAEKVDQPGELAGALERAIAETEKGRPALVEVLTRPEPLILRA
ncbi:MAG: thiamine pyrophosphate-requiring protein [Actinomycetota bacterium]|nr:thiamine pyrophosphate-requiring protein [Actinomycetota bacterium]